VSKFQARSTKTKPLVLVQELFFCF